MPTTNYMNELVSKFEAKIVKVDERKYDTYITNIIKQHGNELQIYAKAKTNNNVALAKDLVQNVYYRMWKYKETFVGAVYKKDEKYKLNYLKRTFKNVYSTYVKKNNRLTYIDDIDLLSDYYHHETPINQKKYKAEDIVVQLRKLDPIYQNLFIKIMNTSLTLHEIAEEEDVSYEVIKKRLLRGRNKLVKLLTDN